MSKAKDIFDALKDKIDLHENYVATFDTPQGRKVLAHLAKTCHLATPTFSPGDPHMTSFREGQRHVITSILAQLGKDTSDLIKTIEEQHSNEHQS